MWLAFQPGRNKNEPAMSPPIEGSSSHFFTADAAAYCASEIAQAGAVEVFFIAKRGEGGLIDEVESHAFGKDDCVPAITARAKPGDILIHNHPGGDLMPSEADLGIASAMGNEGIGFYIIDDECSRCRVIVKAHDPKQKVLLREKEVAAALAPRSALSHIVDAYEDRPQQRTMGEAVACAFNEDGIAVIEAGTGTGKSFAYLVPSILYALKNEDRVVISTNTINLQEQLLHKDIPMLRAAIGEEFEVEIVKGRSNYVCKRKAGFAADSALSLIEDEFQKELRDVLDWIGKTAVGDRGELPASPRAEVWERVGSEADNCLRVKCPFYEECFYYNSRRRAARAKLLIVNHSLLMSDLSVRRQSNNYSTAVVLPPYKRLILDEAHHLEEVATKNLAQVITRVAVRQLFGRLYRREGGGHGVLGSVQEALETMTTRRLIEASDARIQKLLYDIMPRVVDVRDSLDFMIGDFGSHFMRIAGIEGIKPREEQRIRITEELKTNPLWKDECETLLQAMAQEILQFVELNREVLASFSDLDEKAELLIQNSRLEWGAIIGRLDTLRKSIVSFLESDDSNCRWVELAASRQGGARDTIVRICLAPVDVRELLKVSLHDRMKTEVMTSATLTVDKSFDFFEERAGIPKPAADAEPEYDEEGMKILQREPVEPRPIHTHLLPTPFDYRNQVFFGVPTDLPDPRDAGFDEELANLINHSVAITGGRAFILFTSFGQLRRVADLCEPTIRKLGIDVLRQGEDSRDLLLRRFREDESSVLFATSSFWEGVDVKGRALELLILAKLPFAVPSDPIQEAQFEYLKRQGRDPFDNLVVPRAVIRFKQGFGRLIRSRTDRGAVIIADKRVTQMRYGRRFLQSLPDLQVRKALSHDLMRDMEGFFAGHDTPPATNRAQKQ